MGGRGGGSSGSGASVPGLGFRAREGEVSGFGGSKGLLRHIFVRGGGEWRELLCERVPVMQVSPSLRQAGPLPPVNGHADRPQEHVYSTV